MQDNTLERIVPDQMDDNDSFDRLTLQLHIDRYQFAIRHALPGKLLDIACGTGYGAYQILQSGKFGESQVYAVDSDGGAIEYGKSRYAHPRLNFICADAQGYSDQVLYDSIVSLETIEHLRDPVSYARNLNSILKKEGILIISAPVTPSTDANPHHFSDFTPNSFRNLLYESGFTLVAEYLQKQPYSLAELFSRKNKRLSQRRSHLGRFYIRNPRVLVRRIRSLFKDGFVNKYLTLALRKT